MKVQYYLTENLITCYIIDGPEEHYLYIEISYIWNSQNKPISIRGK